MFRRTRSGQVDRRSVDGVGLEHMASRSGLILEYTCGS